MPPIPRAVSNDVIDASTKKIIRCVQDTSSVSNKITLHF